MSKGDYVVCKILKKSNSSRKQNGKPKEGSVIANIFDHQNHDLLSQFGNKESTSSDEMALEDDSPSVFRNDTAKVPPQHVEEKNYTSIGIDINSDIIRASGRGNPNLSPQSGNNESTSTNEMALNDNSHSEIRNDTTEVLPQHVEDNGMDISPDKVYQHGASGPGNPNLLLQFGNNGSTSSDEMPLDDNSPSEIHNDTTKVLPQNVEEITDDQMDISPDFFFQHGVSAPGIPNLLQQYGNNENTNSDAMTLDDNSHNDMTEVLPHFRTLSGAQESSTEGASLADVSEIIEGLQPDELCPIDSNCFFGPRELGFDDGTNSMGYLF